MAKLLTLNTDRGEVYVNPDAIAFIRPTNDFRETEICVQTGHTFKATQEAVVVKANHDAAADAEGAATRATAPSSSTATTSTAPAQA